MKIFIEYLIFFKRSLDRLISILKMTQKKITELENKSIEIIQREKRENNQNV